MIDLKNAATGKEVPENGNPKIILSIVDNFLDFNNLQKCKRLKKLTPKEMLQRLTVVFAQVKAGNTSKNLLNKIRQVIYSFYGAKEITKKVYNNIINSIKLQNRTWIVYFLILKIVKHLILT